jgi:hypothetical protein
MPDYQFTFQVSGISSQKATAIRDRLVARFEEDNVQVTSSTMAQTTHNYRVRGVDCSTGDTFDETVEAANEADARQQVVGSSASKVVVMVRGL